MTTYTLRGALAAYVGVTTPELPAESGVIYLSEGKIVIGLRDLPLEKSSLPPEVKDSITRHFRHVFSLEHETWRGPGPSPRAVYMDALKPWTIEVNE